ncbi:ADP-ribosylglycohydrolase family protein [Oculatella sp. LEGE 06141]|uniref:ADP-ribosylglycohydrolase family protein n=1 Tax=Oculatella sp. LEGE 06141 TaxID=1828648 RepID=UPI0018826D0D|nr:ADP-ribosylglycohydrolase family protein [Oculatella sp. LEGE 06141]MBE9179068.1 ADP-ribosylglycohydrolase family protein [Oculatella sp. LEGE 06141]
MLGAIAGDIIGSVYERYPIKTKTFPLFQQNSRFTDDTVLTVAVAETLLEGGSYVDRFHHYFRRYPDAGYGSTFCQWAASANTKPYNSWGNGSAMRVSAIGFGFDRLEQVLQEAERSAAVTHNHPEGIKGAQATAAAIFLARTEGSKEAIRSYVVNRFGYDLSRSLAEIRPAYQFDVSCQGSVPQAIAAFLESTDVEDAIRNAISLGGDSDTLACIAGGIAHAFYGSVPEAIAQPALARLDPQLRTMTETFMAKHGLS